MEKRRDSLSSISHSLYRCGFSIGYASVICAEQTDTLQRLKSVCLTWNRNLIPPILNKFNITVFESIVSCYCKKESQMLTSNMYLFSPQLKMYMYFMS